MKHVLSIEKLLGVIAFIGAITLGLFGWDAERAMSRLDAISTDLTATSTQVQRLSGDVASLRVETDNHEHRITVMETTRNN